MSRSIKGIVKRLRHSTKLAASAYQNQDLINLLKLAPEVDSARKGIRRTEKDSAALDFVAPQAINEFFPPITVRNEAHLQGSAMGMVSIRLAHYALYLGLDAMGVRYNQVAPEVADLVLNWSYKMHDGPPECRMYIEHGWLPRSAYQISPDGTNGLSHVARDYRYKDLGDDETNVIEKRINALKKAYSKSVREDRVSKFVNEVKEPFILFALQLANDANLKYSNSAYADLYGPEQEDTRRLVEACVESIPGLHLPFKTLIKKHPVDRNQYGNLHGSDDYEFMDEASDIRSHEIFASGLCRGVIAINSNTLHEASVWGIPSVALGSLLWSGDCGVRPYPERWDGDAEQDGLPMKTLSYLSWLLDNQWTLDDFLNPVMLSALLESRGRCVPGAVRNELTH